MKSGMIAASVDAAAVKASLSASHRSRRNHMIARGFFVSDVTITVSPPSKAYQIIRYYGGACDPITHNTAP
jgi:hypothetical protein